MAGWRGRVRSELMGPPSMVALAENSPLILPMEGGLFTLSLLVFRQSASVSHCTLSTSFRARETAKFKSVRRIELYMVLNS